MTNPNKRKVICVINDGICSVCYAECEDKNTCPDGHINGEEYTVIDCINVGGCCSVCNANFEDEDTCSNGHTIGLTYEP